MQIHEMQPKTPTSITMQSKMHIYNLTLEQNFRQNPLSKKIYFEEITCAKTRGLGYAPSLTPRHFGPSCRHTVEVSP